MVDEPGGRGGRERGGGGGGRSLESFQTCSYLSHSRSLIGDSSFEILSDLMVGAAPVIPTRSSASLLHITCDSVLCVYGHAMPYICTVLKFS